MAYRKSSYTSQQNLNINSSSNTPLLHNLTENLPRGLYGRRGSKIDSFNDISSLKQSLFISNEKGSSILTPQKNDTTYLQPKPKKLSYLSRDYINKKGTTRDMGDECNNNDKHYLFTQTFNQPYNQTILKKVSQPTTKTENVLDSNLQQEFVKRLLNAHNTVDNLLRGRGRRIEDESNYLIPKFSRHQETESSNQSGVDCKRRFNIPKYNFITKKYSQSPTNSTSTIDSESSSAYSSSSMENSSVPENISEDDDTSVDSVLNTDCEEDLPEEEITAHFFLEVNLSEYVPNSKNTTSKSGENTIKISLPTCQKKFNFLNITNKKLNLKNPFNNIKGSTHIILPQYNKSAVTLITTLPSLRKNCIKKVKEKSGEEKPIMVKKKQSRLKRMKKVDENEDDDVWQCKAEISIQHFSYSYKKSDQIKPFLHPPPEKLIRLHLRLTNHHPLKSDTTSTFILNKQTIAIEKFIKLGKRRRKEDKNKVSKNDKKIHAPNLVNFHMFEGKHFSTRKNSLTPQYNLKVPEIFLKGDVENKITNDVFNKGKRKPFSGVNAIKMLIDKQNQNIPSKETENHYKSIKKNLKKTNFPDNVLLKKPRKFKMSTLDNKRIGDNDKIDNNCTKVTKILHNDNHNVSIMGKENNQKYSVDIDEKLIERFCNTNHILKPTTIIKNYSLPTVPKKMEGKEKEMIVEDDNKNDGIRFIRYKSPKRLKIDEDKKIFDKIFEIKTKHCIRRSSVAPEVTNFDAQDKRTLIRSYSECPKVNKNVFSHSLHNFGVSLKSVKERLLQTKEELERKPPKEVFIPHWRKTSRSVVKNQNIP
uniref:Troponin T, skeletal muscle (inferred by orthology to a D. melanogaster protein) n=1 Tax=Strongyloides venezuelensis TaxID=75913 RepID=A0A0K0FE04_STRVS